MVGAAFGLKKNAKGNILGDNRPARAIIPCGPLHYGFLIEIEAIAATDI